MKNNLTLSSILLILISSLRLLVHNPAHAAVITSTAMGGSWSANSTWIGGQVPSANDTAIISSGSVVEVFGTINVRRVVIGEGASVGARLVLLGNTTFNVSGSLVVGASSSNNEDNIFEVANGECTVANLVLNNSTQDNRRAIVRINNGTLRINGTVNYSATGQEVRRRVEITGNGSLIVNGTVNGIATLELSSSSTVTYNYEGNTIITAANYANLIVNGAGRKTIGTFGGTRTISGTLTVSNGSVLSLANSLIINGNILLNNGIIATNSNTLELGANCTIGGTFDNNNFIDLSGRGSLLKRANTVDQFRITYPIGTGNLYTPFILDSLEANIGGSPGTRFLEVQVEGKRSGLALGTGQALNRSWRLRANGISNISKLAFKFSYAEADVPAGVTESTLNRVARLGNSGWGLISAGANINHNTNVISINSPNVLINGEYTIGNETAFPPVFTFVYTVQNGNWSTPAVWSNNQVPTANTNIYVHHNIDNLPAAAVANDIVITSSGSINIRQNSFTANGKMEIFGALIDHHSGGNNHFRGKFTLHPGGLASFLGSGGGADMVFFDDVDINGELNLNGGITFNRTLNTVIKFRSSVPVVSQRNPVISRVDTLFLEVNHPSSPNFVLAGGNGAAFIIGDSTINRNLVVVNRAKVALNNGTGIDAIALPGFSHKWLQAPNSLLSITRGNAFTGGLVVDANAAGNTVEYAAPGSQNVPAIDYHHLTISGDRADRVKTLGSGRDILVAGNLTVNDNGAQLQFANNSNGQKLTVLGNVAIFGNGRLVTAATNSGAKNHLIIGGKLIINSNSLPALNASVNDSTFTRVTFTGTGTVAEGNGRATFRSVRFTSSDSVSWSLNGTATLDDSIAFNVAKFRATRGTFFISNNAKVIMTGSASSVRLNNFIITDRADRTAQVTQRVPLTVDSTFNITISGQSGDAFYDFRGMPLTIMGPFNMGINSNNSALRADSNSVLTISGAGTVPNFILRNNFRNLGKLVYDRPQQTLSIGQNVLIYNELFLKSGSIQPNNRLSLQTGATVVRAKGRILANLSGTNIYNVAYVDSLITGPELNSIPAIGRLTINAKTDDVVAFASSPQVNNNLVYINGIMQPVGNNLIRLGNNSTVRIASTTANRLFPIGIGTRRAFFNMKVNSVSSGEFSILPVFQPHPQRANAPNYLNKYLTIGGSAAGINYDIALSYDNNEVVGSENDFNAYFFNGSSWTTSNGSLDINNNVASMTGITALGDFTAGTNMGDTITTILNTIGNQLISIYPNPANQKVVLKTHDLLNAHAPVYIINSIGQVMKKAYLSNEGQAVMNTAELPAGLYLIQIDLHDGKPFTRQVIIQH